MSTDTESSTRGTNSPTSDITQPTSIASDEEETKPLFGLSEDIVQEETSMEKKSRLEHERKMREEAQAQFDSTVKAQRMKRLYFLLEKSTAYATILSKKLAKEQDEARERGAQLDKVAANETKPEEQPTRSKRTRSATNSKQKTTDANYQITDYIKEDDVKRRKTASGNVSIAIREEQSSSAAKEPVIKPSVSARQPSLVTGGVLRDYQLAGVEWLVSLWENGLNGILADEMGLGKTLQTIGFLAHLKAKKVSGPYLIVTPLSTLANWVSEFKRFAPSINVILYHGTKQDRGHMIKSKMKKKDEFKHDFPVVITTYEIVINDRKILQKYNWKYIVVDEGHRLKNMNCKLIQELKTYSSANRLLLTGTPLQNNLSELWSLLNFLLPDIFDDLEIFQSWFDFSDINAKEGQERIMKQEEEDNIVTILHTVLSPFLLRRLKTDVETSLPKKKEYLLYAPLTQPQKNLHDAILKRELRDYLIKKKAKLDTKKEETSPASKRRARKDVDYKEKSDTQFFKEVIDESGEKEEQEDEQAIEDQKELTNAIRKVNGMHLQNLVMQLRKICNHPFLFDWPIDPKTKTPVISKDLAAQSGKVLLLDRLLTGLFKKGHKVLVFSQMTKMLDILEDWATELKGWPVCRLDGSVDQDSRREQIEEFSRPNSKIKLFLLSTRAGGLGINLTAADTVVLFDSDWNPQMDLQAQDRVHRIGQTKPVLIYRLVTANTVEAKMLEKASAKRRLEKLVISKDRFKTPVAASRDENAKERTVRELAEILASNDGEKIQIVAEGDKIISDSDLEQIMDRSPSVFETKNASGSNHFREVDPEEMKDYRNEVLSTRA